MSNTKVILPSNSIMLTCAEELKNFCSGIFDLTGVKEFDYSRHYFSGELFATSTEPSFTDNYYKSGLFMSYEECEYARILHNGNDLYTDLYTPNLTLIKSMPTRNKHMKVMEIAKSMGLSVNKFYIIYRREDYYELFGFGGKYRANQENEFVTFHTANAFRFLEWTDYFKMYFEKKLLDFDKEKIYFEGYRDIDEIINAHKTTLRRFDERTGKIVEVELSVQEYKCLASLSYGKSMKEIAREFSLSVRTVETYINRIKLKTGVFNKSELVSLFYDFYRYSNLCKINVEH